MKIEKFTEFFSMTRRERVGTLVVLVMLAAAILFSYCERVRHDGDEATGSKPSAQVVSELKKAVESKPLSNSKTEPRSSSKKKAKARGGKQKGKAKQKKGKSAKSASKASQSENREMEEVPSF